MPASPRASATGQRGPSLMLWAGQSRSCSLSSCPHATHSAHHRFARLQRRGHAAPAVGEGSGAARIRRACVCARSTHAPRLAEFAGGWDSDDRDPAALSARSAGRFAARPACAAFAAGFGPHVELGRRACSGPSCRWPPADCRSVPHRAVATGWEWFFERRFARHAARYVTNSDAVREWCIRQRVAGRKVCRNSGRH